MRAVMDEAVRRRRTAPQISAAAFDFHIYFFKPILLSSAHGEDKKSVFSRAFISSASGAFTSGDGGAPGRVSGAELICLRLIVSDSGAAAQLFPELHNSLLHASN